MRGPSDAPCLSCLSFVMRMLFLGATPDHERAQKTIYNTDDLLLYLAGLHGLRDREARLKRIDELALPQDVREDVVRLVNTIDIPGAGNTAANTAKTPCSRETACQADAAHSAAAEVLTCARAALILRRVGTKSGRDAA